jgi:hypothetical protein
MILWCKNSAKDSFLLDQMDNSKENLAIPGCDNIISHLKNKKAPVAGAFFRMYS